MILANRSRCPKRSPFEKNRPTECTCRPSGRRRTWRPSEPSRDQVCGINPKVLAIFIAFEVVEGFLHAIEIVKKNLHHKKIIILSPGRPRLAGRLGRHQPGGRLKTGKGEFRNFIFCCCRKTYSKTHLSSAPYACSWPGWTAAPCSTRRTTTRPGSASRWRRGGSACRYTRWKKQVISPKK